MPITYTLARLKRPSAAFLLNGPITRPATITITFGQPYPSYMQSFIKIRGAVLEKSAVKKMTLCNFNKDAVRKWEYQKMFGGFMNKLMWF